MELTVDALEALGTGCHIYDMRSESEIGYGAIPGSVPMAGEALLQSPPEKDGLPLVVVCARGVLSVDVAEAFARRAIRRIA